MADGLNGEARHVVQVHLCRGVRHSDRRNGSTCRSSGDRLRLARQFAPGLRTDRAYGGRHRGARRGPVMGGQADRSGPCGRCTTSAHSGRAWLLQPAPGESVRILSRRTGGPQGSQGRRAAGQGWRREHGRRAVQPRCHPRCSGLAGAGLQRPVGREPIAGTHDRVLVQPPECVCRQGRRAPVRRALCRSRDPAACARQVRRPAPGKQPPPCHALLPGPGAKRGRWHHRTARPVARTERELRPRIAGTAYRRRQRRLHPDRRARTGAHSHRLDRGAQRSFRLSLRRAHARPRRKAPPGRELHEQRRRRGRARDPHARARPRHRAPHRQSPGDVFRGRPAAPGTDRAAGQELQRHAGRHALGAAHHGRIA